MAQSNYTLTFTYDQGLKFSNALRIYLPDIFDEEDLKSTITRVYQGSRRLDIKHLDNITGL